jgi:uncharacterized protein (TIGR02001 family)
VIGQVARAEQAPRLDFSAAVATDYVSRGVSRGDGRPSAAVGADVTKDALYAGVWVSTLGGADAADAEVLVYGGWRPDRWGYSFDLGAIGRSYPGAAHRVAAAYLELQASGSQTIGPLQYGLRIIFAPKAANIPGSAPLAPSQRGDGYYLELNAAYELTRRLKASTALGRQSNSYDALDRAVRRRDASYTIWNLGLAYDLNEHLNFDLRYWDTDARSFGSAYRPGLVGGLTARF